MIAIGVVVFVYQIILRQLLDRGLIEIVIPQKGELHLQNLVMVLENPVPGRGLAHLAVEVGGHTQHTVGVDVVEGAGPVGVIVGLRDLLAVEVGVGDLPRLDDTVFGFVDVAAARAALLVTGRDCYGCQDEQG